MGENAHNAFHEFFAIKEPGRVIVHTVFSGDGDKPLPSQAPPAVRPFADSSGSSEVVHQANCDLCDSRIRGKRYVSDLKLIHVLFS